MTAAEKAKIKADYPAYTTRNPCKLGGYKEYYDDNSEILFVGSITSPQGINRGYYYAADRNQFWELVDEVHDKNFPTLKTTYKFLDLKNNLKDIAHGVPTKLSKAHTIIKFEENLKICHFAICDIIEECKFKKAGAAIDSLIVKSSIKINDTKINDILKNSKIRLIVINSQFVMDLWNENKAKFATAIVPILVTSPSSANRISKAVKIKYWVSDIK